MPKPEAMTAETFSEDDYRDKLLDEGYSEVTARMLAKKKKESLTDLSESPLAYKDIDEVMKAQEDLVEIQVKLRPIAVVKG